MSIMPPGSESNNDAPTEDDVHYRLYLGHDGEPAAVCVQWFDYYGMDAARFLTEDRYSTEVEALRALWAARFVACPLCGRH